MKNNLKLIIIAVLCMWMGQKMSAEEHYLVGGCTASGWNTGEYTRSPVAMVNVSENVWVWAGKLTVGEGDNGRFKIPNTSGDWSGYWAPNQGTVLTSEWSDLSTDGTDDKKFCVSAEGIYRITINTSTLKIKAEKMSEPSKDGDYYLIGSVNDYYWYAGTVTSGEQNYKARLTADLDFSETGFFPLSCDKYKFKGEFDGASHIISNAVIMGSNNNVAFIRYAADGTNIHDLVIDGSFTGNAKVGGIIGFARDGGEVKLTNVINKANATATGSSDANAAGLVGCATDNTKITALNCANMGEVRGQNGNCAAFLGWSQPGTTFTNCWNSGAIYNIEGSAQLYRNSGEVTATNCYDLTEVGDQGTRLAANTISTAEFCYQLNGNMSGGTDWRLSIGTDAHPYPFDGHGTVYANGYLYCDGTTKPGTVLENEEKESVRDAHNFNDWGFCKNKPNGTDQCNELNTNFISPAGDGYYEIATKEQLNWFAVRVNGHNTYHSHTDGVRNINAKLTADIDFSDQTNMIGGDGNSTGYQGTFDGQGHKVTLGYNISQKNVALFRTLASAHIMNLVTDGTIRNENNSCAGGIFAGSHGASVVENCVSYVSLNRDNDGDATFGGIGAYMHDNGKIQNCAFYGSINASASEGNAGILGYANGGDNIKLTNCVIDATLSYTNGDLFARNTSSLTNCYYVNTGKTNASATVVTAEQVENGELAYMINGNKSTDVIWYQKLGEDADAEPLPFGTYVVYANGDLYCDGTAKGTATYSNVEGANRDAHNYDEWGFCTNVNGSSVTCDQIQPGFATLTDGYYQIGNAKELNWFAVWTDRESASVNAKLTTNIDMTEVSNFPGIGSGENNFTGIFDGQRHIITNMKMDWDREGVGLVNRAADGAQVKNVTIASNCSFKGSKAVAGLIGGAYGTGDIYIENCGNEGSVTSTGQNAGGVVGVCLNNGGMIAHLTNVYNVGTITGVTGGESGSISGWMANAVLKNCYSIAGYPTSENTHGFQEGNQFARGNGINLTNCYDFGTGDWGKNNGSWGSVFVGDHKIAEVNETNMGVVFAGLYDAEGGNVWRMEYDGWAHPVLYDPATLVLSENVPNRFVSQNGVDLTLKRTTVADTWNTICLPFALDKDGVKNLFGESAQVAELAGSEGSTLHFTTVSTIDAGKAYLVKPSEPMTTIDLTGVDLVADAPEATTEGGYAFTGIYEPTTIVANDLFVAAENKLVPSTGEGKLKAFRAYFHNTTGAESRFTDFVIDNIATGLKTVMPAFTEVQGTVFDLQGRRTVRPVKGLYIVGGKKMVVK